jgi:hypothetical protein
LYDWRVIQPQFFAAADSERSPRSFESVTGRSHEEKPKSI